MNRKLVILIALATVAANPAAAYDLRDIFRQIDAMPMQRDEMRAKTEAGVKVTLP